MKNELLSIGEAAKLKQVSVKSLRYYETIGILKPAYVDPSSGYRYYSPNQMIDLDVILTCIELGIPLKSLTDHKTPRITQPERIAYIGPRYRPRQYSSRRRFTYAHQFLHR